MLSSYYCGMAHLMMARPVLKCFMEMIGLFWCFAEDLLFQFFFSFSFICFFSICEYFLPPANEVMGQGNVFAHVCHSVHREEGVP